MKEGFAVVFLMIVVVSIFDTVNQLFLKSAINSLAIAPAFRFKNIVAFIARLLKAPRVWISFLFSTLSFSVWLTVLSKADLNLAFSVDSMHYIFIALASYFFLKEKLSPARLFGTVFVIAGIILVSISH